MTVNGTAVQGVLSLSVENKNFFSADTWSAEVALSALPSGFGPAFWEGQSSIDVQFLASSTPGTALGFVIGGAVDETSIDYGTMMLSVSGRDYTAPLIDGLSNDKFTNKTSSQVATLYAQKFGLTPQVTATATQIGRYLNNQTDYMAEDISYWRVLSFLAQQEGFDLYTQGKTLVFAPAVPDPSPLLIRYTPGTDAASANAPTVKTSHKKVLAGPVTVQVRSWDHGTKQPIISTIKSQKTQATPAASGKPSAPAATLTRPESESGTTPDGPFYIERSSGLTQKQADQLAAAKLKEFTSHERTVVYSGPGILGVDTRRTVRLVGTGTAADMVYPIKSISRKIGWGGGFTMEIQAKSGSPDEAIKL